MALTAQQITLVRTFTGDSDTDTPVFSDTELQVFAGIAETDYAEFDLVGVVTVFVLRGLLANRAKFADYVQNESQENESQIFRQVKTLLEKWESQLGLLGQELYLGSIDLGLSSDEDGIDDWSSWYA